VADGSLSRSCCLCHCSHCECVVLIEVLQMEYAK
jgi:hypothetical protein